MKLHGLKLHNICRYGETDNLVEFSPDAAYFFNRTGKFSEWINSGLRKKATGCIETWVHEAQPRILSIVGMQDGDPNNSNGSGKSTIIEAISYALFEKMVRDFVHKKSNKGSSTLSIVPDNRKVDSSFVELLFSAEDELWLLTRGRKLSKKSHSPIFELRCVSNQDLDNVCMGHRGDDTGEYLHRLIKMDFDSFCNSVMFGQNDAGKFLVGTDKDRKEILINILQLQVIEKYLEETRSRKKKCTEDIMSVESQIQLLRDQISSSSDPEEMKKQIADLEKSIAEKEKLITDFEAEIKGIEEEIEKSDYKNLTEKIALVDQSIKSIEEKYEEEGKQLKTALQEAKDRAEELEKTRSIISKSIDGIKVRIDAFNKTISSFDAEKNEKNLGIVKKAKEAKPIRQAELSELNRQINDLSTEEGKCAGSIRYSKERLDAFSKDLLRAQDGGEITCSECESIVTLEHIQRKKEVYEDEIKKLSDAASLIIEIKKECTQKIDDVKKRLENIEAYLNKESVFLREKSDFDQAKVDLEKGKGELEDAEKIHKETEDKIPDAKDKITQKTKAMSTLDTRKGEELKPHNENKEKLTKAQLDAKKFYDKCKKQIEEINSKIKTEREEIVSSVEKKTKLASALEAIGDKIKAIEELEKKLTCKNGDLGRIKYLEKLFGPTGIQTQLIYEYLPLLNQYINEYASIISNMMIEIDADLGGSEKLSIDISGDSSSRLEGLSGGEGAKVKLAANIALGLLSFVRRRDIPEFICLDEVLAPVDTASREAIFVMLERLQEKFKDIIVISHHPSVQDRISDRIVVNKVNGMSIIESGV